MCGMYIMVHGAIVLLLLELEVSGSEEEREREKKQNKYLEMVVAEERLSHGQLRLSQKLKYAAGRRARIRCCYSAAWTRRRSISMSAECLPGSGHGHDLYLSTRSWIFYSPNMLPFPLPTRHCPFSLRSNHSPISLPHLRYPPISILWSPLPIC